MYAVLITEFTYKRLRQVGSADYGIHLQTASTSVRSADYGILLQILPPSSHCQLREDSTETVRRRKSVYQCLYCADAYYIIVHRNESSN